VLPGGEDITTAAGDEAEFVEYATGDWRCTSYQGTVASIASGSDAQAETGTDTEQRTWPATALKAAAEAHAGSPIKAWVNFNGTGTVSIRASSNVSSITDLGVGNYRVNFSSALSDADYAVLGLAETYTATLPAAGTQTTTQLSNLFIESRRVTG
jgi:hypothetical protein